MTKPGLYSQRSLRRLAGLQQRLDVQSRRLSLWRMGVFVLAVLGAAAWGDFVSLWAGAAWLSLGVVGFALLVHRHQRLKQQQRFCAHLQRLRQTHLARLELDWQQLPEPVSDLPAGGHPYALDLDIVGPFSLYRLLHHCFSVEGGERLLQWLLAQEPDPDAIALRQQRVAALKPLVSFRDRLHLWVEESAVMYRHGGSKGPWRSAEVLGLVATAEQPAPGLGVLGVLSLLAVSTLVLAALAWSMGFPAWAWQGSLTLYILLYLQQRRAFEQLFSQSQALQYGLSRLLSLFSYLEAQASHSSQPMLRELLSPFADEQPPTRLLRKVSWIVAAASLQASPLVWVAVNLICPWDLYFARQLELLKPRLKQRLPLWLDTLWELDALGALAHYAWLHPDYPFASWHAEGLAVKALGHPLLSEPHKIRNDFQLTETGQGFLITGSNMAGKSTFLKSLGLNQVLAQAGSVVDADSLETCWLRVWACIKVSDSVTDGLSYFYAEVRRLKAILEAIQQPHDRPVLYLIDEIFKGTNNRERLLGSQAYIQALTQGLDALGGVSTHDLELVQLAENNPRLQNYHFREAIVGHNMVFDYRLRPGPCPTTNALRIMALEGLPVPGDFLGQESL